MMFIDRFYVARVLLVHRKETLWKATLKKFRFRRATDNAAIVLKININTMQLEIEDELDQIEKLDDLIDELPELQPRFLIYSCR